MRWTSALAIYVLFWSLSVFLVLPWGVRTGREAGADHVPGTAESAPHEFRPGRVALWVTVVATVLFGLYYLNYVNGWITAQTITFFNLEDEPQVR
jgi:predicted secreted protein